MGNMADYLLREIVLAVLNLVNLVKIVSENDHHHPGLAVRVTLIHHRLIKKLREIKRFCLKFERKYTMGSEAYQFMAEVARIV